jgi:hypothetical protein
MQTPVAQNNGLVPTLYGDKRAAINRPAAIG